MRRPNKMIVGLSALVGTFLVSTSVQAQEQEYTMAMTWSFEASHLGYLVAQDRGIFQEEGVNVEVIRGHGAADTIRRLITGDIEFGIIDATMLMQAMSEDPDAKMIMVANTIQRSPYNVLYVQDRNVNSVEDLGAATFGDTGGSVAQLYPTFLEFALSETERLEDKYERVQLDAAVRIPSLFQGDVDVVASMAFEFPNVDFRAQQVGVDLGTFDYADYGFDPYTYGVVAQPSFVAENPEVVKAVVRAVLYGWKWACENPKDATELLSNYQQDVPRETMRPQVDIALQHVGSEDTRQHGLGYMNPEKWDTTYKLGLKGWDLDEEDVPTVDELYDRSYMPDEPIMATCG